MDEPAQPVVPKASRDDAARFASLLKESQEQLFAFIHSLVRDFNDADDLLQRSAIILWQKFHTYDGSRSFLAWAMGIARFEVTNFVRTRSRSKLYFSDELNLLLIEAQESIRHDETEARRAALGQCIQKLRERDQALLREFYGADERVTDLADRIGRSSHSVHNSLRRIRRSLFECIRRTIRTGDAGGEAMA